MSTDAAPVVLIGEQRTATIPIAENLIDRVLEPYSYKGCRYLAEASYSATDTSLVAEAEFSIPEPVYIRNTGHFNAVELVLCFNQLAYTAFAAAVLNAEIAALRGWSITDYCENQLASMLIRATSSRYKRPINAQKFSARLDCRGLEVVERTWRYLKVPCLIEYFDDGDGAAVGEFELAVLNIP